MESIILIHFIEVRLKRIEAIDAVKRITSLKLNWHILSGKFIEVMDEYHKADPNEQNIIN